MMEFRTSVIKPLYAKGYFLTMGVPQKTAAGFNAGMHQKRAGAFTLHPVKTSAKTSASTTGHCLSPYGTEQEEEWLREMDQPREEAEDECMEKEMWEYEQEEK